MLCLDASKYAYVGKSQEGYFKFRRRSRTFELVVSESLRYYINGKLLHFPGDEHTVKTENFKT